MADTKTKQKNRKAVIIGIVAAVLIVSIALGVITFALNPPVLDLEKSTVEELEKLLTTCDYKNLTYWTPNLIFNDAVDEFEEIFGYDSGAVAFGDTLVIDYSAYYFKKDGTLETEAFASNVKQNVVVGDADVFEGVFEFDEKLINLPVGNQSEFEFTFPKDENDPALSERKIKFIVKIHSGIRAYTDANVAEYTDFNTVAEHREFLYDKYAKLEVEAAIEELLDERTEKTPLKKGDVVSNGDTVTFSTFVVKHNGEKIKNFITPKILVIGSKKSDFEVSGYLGFDSKMVGSLVGTEITYKYTVPEGAEDLSLVGKTLDVTLKIDSAYSSEVPEYNDALVQDILGYLTTDEFEKATYENAVEGYKKEIAGNEKANSKEKIWVLFVKNSTIKSYPKGLFKAYKKGNVNMCKDQYEGYVDMGYTGSFEEMYPMAGIELLAKTQAQQHLYSYYILKKEGIVFTQNDYDAYAQLVSTESPYPNMEAMENDFAEYYDEFFYDGYGAFLARTTAINEKVLDILYGYAKRI